MVLSDRAKINESDIICIFMKLISPVLYLQAFAKECP